MMAGDQEVVGRGATVRGGKQLSKVLAARPETLCRRSCTLTAGRAINNRNTSVGKSVIVCSCTCAVTAANRGLGHLLIWCTHPGAPGNVALLQIAMSPHPLPRCSSPLRPAPPTDTHPKLVSGASGRSLPSQARPYYAKATNKHSNTRVEFQSSPVS